MTIQQLRAQIAALQDATMDENRNFRSAYDEGKFDALSAVDALLDSMQEEPQFKKLAGLQHVNETCKENGNSLTQEFVNVWHDMSEEAENGRNIIIIDPKDFYGAVLRRGGSQLKNHNKERYVKWAYIDELIEL